MNSGVTSLTAVMTKTDLGGEAYVSKYGEEEYVDLVSAYSLYIGVASIVMAVVGFGTLAQNVPGAVKTGFKVSVLFSHLLCNLFFINMFHPDISGVVNLVS